MKEASLLGRVAGVAVLLVLVVWSRGPMLHDGLWRDEAASVYIASAPDVGTFFARSQTGDYNPPLFNLLLAGWGGVFGFSEPSMKTFAAGCGLLALGGIALLAHALAGEIAAWIASWLALSHPIVKAMSVELRPYSLSIALVSLCLYLVIRIRSRVERRQEFRRQAVALVVALPLLGYSHYAGTLVAVVLGAFALSCLFASPSDPGWRIVLLAAVLAGGALLLWAPLAWGQREIGRPWASNLIWGSRWRWPLVQALDAVFNVSADSGPVVLFPLGAFFLVVICLGYALTREPRTIGFVLVFICLLVSATVFGVLVSDRRYFAVPAALGCVLFGSIPVLVSSAASRPPWSERFHPAFIVAGSLLAAVSLRGGADSLLPKSGIRTASFERSFSSADLVLVAPDYLAPTVWYYGVPEPRIRGFVRWSTPVPPNFRDYPRVWTDPAAIDGTLAHLESEIRRRRLGRLVVASETGLWENPLQFQEKSASLVERLEKHFPVLLRSDYSGALETVRVTEFDVRPHRGFGNARSDPR